MSLFLNSKSSWKIRFWLFRKGLNLCPIYSLQCRGLAQRGGGVGGIFLPLPSPLAHFFQLTFFQPTPLGNNNYFLGPILHSYQIQDGGLIRKCTLACIQYACTAGYPIYNKFVCLGVHHVEIFNYL